MLKVGQIVNIKSAPFFGVSCFDTRRIGTVGIINRIIQLPDGNVVYTLLSITSECEWLEYELEPTGDYYYDKQNRYEVGDKVEVGAMHLVDTIRRIYYRGGTILYDLDQHYEVRERSIAPLDANYTLF